VLAIKKAKKGISGQTDLFKEAMYQQKKLFQQFLQFLFIVSRF
jgi:hypothetical protein